MESQTTLEDQQLEAAQPEVAAEFIDGSNDRPPIGEAIFERFNRSFSASRSR